MASQYVYEYGKRWNAVLPRQSIKWKMGKIHVCTSGEAVKAMIEERCVANNFPKTLTRQSVAYALICHQKNYELYMRVMGGSSR